MGTIKVPRNLRMITERLPSAQYDDKEKRYERAIMRNASLPVIDERINNISHNPPVIDLKRYRAGSLDPREEVKSARNPRIRVEDISKAQAVAH